MPDFAILSPKRTTSSVALAEEAHQASDIRLTSLIRAQKEAPRGLPYSCLTKVRSRDVCRCPPNHAPASKARPPMDACILLYERASEKKCSSPSRNYSFDASGFEEESSGLQDLHSQGCSRPCLEQLRRAALEVTLPSVGQPSISSWTCTQSCGASAAHHQQSTQCCSRLSGLTWT